MSNIAEKFMLGGREYLLSGRADTGTPISGYPNERFQDLTWPANNGTITMPGDGYLYARRQVASPAFHFLFISNSWGAQISDLTPTGSAKNYVQLLYPASKGQALTLGWSPAGTAPDVLRFIPASQNPVNLGTNAPAATQEEVNEGSLGNKWVSPATLKGITDNISQYPGDEWIDIPIAALPMSYVAPDDGLLQVAFDSAATGDLVHLEVPFTRHAWNGRAVDGIDGIYGYILVSKGQTATMNFEGGNVAGSFLRFIPARKLSI